MSLKDTIRGAREEAAASGNPFDRGTGSKDSNKSGSGSSSSGQSSAQGFERRSAARSKPSREAAAGVRVVSSNGKSKSKSTSNMTKAERKEERKRERAIEDRRYNVTQMYLEQDPAYQKARKVWWGFLIGGIVFMVLAMVLYWVISGQGQGANANMAIVSMVSMALAYGVVIAGLIYDWVKIRPMRKEVEKRTQSMSDKRLQTVLKRKAAESSK
ncbi:MAG: hypothetical protein IKG22_14460 [Atopobiaceae bacterium]|nr:hypothetical protein [Atopobiaceae bacterium]